MASEDGTAAAAQQLGSMSLGESLESKKNDTGKPDAKSGTPTKKLCSACGEKSDTCTLMKCRACKCVWYCDKKCQNRHWKEHKKECKPIKRILEKRGGKLDLGTEKDVGPLETVPQGEECVICMRVLPILESLHRYAECCGNTLCCGCDYQHQMKSQELAAERGQTLERATCAFCREPIQANAEEAIALVRKRAERKDPVAIRDLGSAYGAGRYGLPLDQAKCIDLVRESVSLGNAFAQCQLGTYYYNGEMGLEQNEEEGDKYWKEAAEGGYLVARHLLGSKEFGNGNNVAAMRHMRLSASGGYRKSMDNLIACFEEGLLHHGNLAESLREYYRSRAEMKSEGRDQYIAYLKSTGKYHDTYDF